MKKKRSAKELYERNHGLNARQRHERNCSKFFQKHPGYIPFDLKGVKAAWIDKRESPSTLVFQGERRAEDGSIIYTFGKYFLDALKKSTPDNESSEVEREIRRSGLLD